MATSNREQKRLRDESHVHGPASRTKRIRVSQACNECRKRKERCDGVHPQCGPCSSSKRSCCFDAQPRKRGLPTGYVRVIEIMLGLMFHAIDGVEDCATAILRGEKSLPTWHGAQTSSSLVNSLADSWRRSETSKEIERLLASVDSGDEYELSTRELYDKLEGAFMNRLVIDGDCNSRIELMSPPHTTSPPAYDAGPSMARDTSIAIPMTQSTPNARSFQSLEEPLNLPSHWSHLLERYFTDTHSWFPVATKHDILRQAFSLADHNSETGVQDSLVSSGDRAALFATLAYACYRDTLSLHDTEEQHSDQFDSFEQAQHDSSSFSLSKRLQDEAISNLPRKKEPASYDSGHVQALLVLTILQIDQGRLPQAWITIGQAVYAAVLLDIIPPPRGTSQLTPDARQRSLFVGIFVLETLLAYALGRRPYLRRSDLSAVGPLPIDGMEEWQAWRPLEPQVSSKRTKTHGPGRSLSTFNTFLNLAAILNDQAQGLSNVTETLKMFEYWKTALPPSLGNISSSLEAIEAGIPPQIANLALVSFSIDAALHIGTPSTQERKTGINTISDTPISAHKALEMIKEYKTLAKPSGTCPLVSIYESVLKGHMNNLDLTLPAENVPQLGTSVSQYTGPTNIEKAINHFPLSTPAGSSSLLAQPVMRNPSELGIVPTYEGGLETHPNLLPDTSLFDSLSFLDTADCSHQSEQFLANLGISNEIAPFDIEALFAR